MRRTRRPSRQEKASRSAIRSTMQGDGCVAAEPGAGPHDHRCTPARTSPASVRRSTRGRGFMGGNLRSSTAQMARPPQIVERSSTLPVSAEEAFAWHERAGAFERLTPPWERVTVLERTGGIRDGARTAVTIGVGPARLRWVAAHRDYVEGRQFVDEQAEGPFSHWRHEHRFEPAGAGACRYTDRIELAPPFGAVGAAAGEWLARPRVERMLAYRHATLRDDLAAHARFRD